MQINIARGVSKYEQKKDGMSGGDGGGGLWRVRGRVPIVRITYKLLGLIRGGGGVTITETGSKGMLDMASSVKVN